MIIADSWILSTLMENTADSIYIKDRQCRLWRVSRKMALDLGFSNSEAIYGKTDIELFGEEFGQKTLQDDLQVMETGQPMMGVIESRKSSTGATNWTSTTKLPLRNDQGEVIGLLGITREINELKGSEMEFHWLATHDPLTSLANRYLLFDRIEQAILRAKRDDGLFALLFIDLNGFKQVNDLAGHDQGDRYLKLIARLLPEQVRTTDTVARFGGDEFVVLLNGIHQVQDATHVAEELAQAIHDQVDPLTHCVTAAIGISIFPCNGQDADSLLKAADQAMYLAKKSAIHFTLA